MGVQIDSSWKCERLLKADTRFKVIHKKKKYGLSAAFNAAPTNCLRENMVVLLNAFDRVESIMFEHLLSLIIKTNGEYALSAIT